MMNNSSLSSIPPGLLTQHEARATLPQRKTIKRLAITELVLTIIMMGGGLAEIILSWSDWCEPDDPFNHHNPYDQCFRYTSLGQGIWCSIFPFVAAVLGVIASNSGTSKQLRLVTGFSIVSVASMMVAVGIEIGILQEAFDWHIGPSWYVMWGLLATGFINFFLFIASASYCCSIGNSCGCCSSNNAEVLVVTNGQQSVGTSNGKMNFLIELNTAI